MIKYPGSFSVKLPEIYQIEASAACDHACTMCPRPFYSRENQQKLFDPELLKTMIRRGDLNGSYFTELQMSGEPLLHPELYTLIDLLRSEGILVGLSTHGDLFPEFINVCENLDYITVSVDSITRRNEIRKSGFQWTGEEIFLDHLWQTANFFSERKIPIDFQFIELKGWEKEMKILENYFNHKGFYKNWVTIRSIPDCCICHRKGTRLTPEEDKGICLNPWLSCSIQSNGNVSSCCFAWGDENVYGNLHEKSLEEIWNGPEVERLRQNHSKGFTYLPDLCMKCYTRSPVLLHWELYLNSVVAYTMQRIEQKLFK